MRIDELKSIPQWKPIYDQLFNTDWNESSDIAEFLEDNGFYELGSGFFSSVYGHDNLDIAIKLVDDDHNYIKYINFYAKYGRQNPHLPRIYKYKKVGNVEIVITEKLYPLSENQEDLFQVILKFKRYLMNPNNYDEYYVNNVVNYFIDEYSDLAQIIIDLYKIFGKNNIDIHQDNIMQRKDGTLVITDPVHPL